MPRRSSELGTLILARRGYQDEQGDPVALEQVQEPEAHGVAAVGEGDDRPCVGGLGAGLRRQAGVQRGKGSGDQALAR